MATVVRKSHPRGVARVRAAGAVASRSNSPRARAFTLIELLIVVAIIAILAAIAVPNFLEAQTRAKVSRAKADMRSLATAVQAYNVDNNAYPPNNALNPADPQGLQFNPPAMLVPLSTPVSYISNAQLPDPFRSAGDPLAKRIIVYTRLSEEEGLLSVLYPIAGITPEMTARVAESGFYLQSVGPDTFSSFEQCMSQTGNAQQAMVASIQGFVYGKFIYDPTNGTVSVGDIAYTGKGFVTAPF